MFSWAQMWLFNILIPTIILILFTTWVNRWILFSSNARQPWAGKKLWEFFKKSKFLPEECTYLSQICLLKSELHTGQTGILLSTDCLFFFHKMTKQKTNFGVHGHVHVTSSPKCFFYNNYFSHQFNHQNVSREKQLALSSGFCFYNNNNNKNRKKY